MSTQSAHTILNHIKKILIFLAIGFAGFMLLDLVYLQVDGGWKFYFIPLICGYFYLLIDKRMDNDVYAECPNCQKRINISVKWVCSSCGKVHKEKTLITLPCHYCGAVSNDIYCGWCKKEITL